MEATGGCEAALACTLQAAGLRVAPRVPFRFPTQSARPAAAGKFRTPCRVHQAGSPGLHTPIRFTFQPLFEEPISVPA